MKLHHTKILNYLTWRPQLLTRLPVLCSGLLLLALIGWVQYQLLNVWSLPWREYLVTILPVQPHHYSKSWQASHHTGRTLEAALIQQHKAFTSHLMVYQLSAQYGRHFCTGDVLMLRTGTQHAEGHLIIKIAPSPSMPHYQFGIRFIQPLDPIFQNPAQSIFVQRLSYQDGDWHGIKCQ